MSLLLLFNGTSVSAPVVPVVGGNRPGRLPQRRRKARDWENDPAWKAREIAAIAAEVETGNPDDAVILQLLEWDLL